MYLSQINTLKYNLNESLCNHFFGVGENANTKKFKESKDRCEE